MRELKQNRSHRFVIYVYIMRFYYYKHAALYTAGQNMGKLNTIVVPMDETMPQRISEQMAHVPK